MITQTWLVEKFPEILDATHSMEFVAVIETRLGNGGGGDPNMGAAPRVIGDHFLMTPMKIKRWMRDYLEAIYPTMSLEDQKRNRIWISREGAERGECLDSIRNGFLREAAMDPAMAGKDHSEVLIGSSIDTRLLGGVNSTPGQTSMNKKIVEKKGLVDRLVKQFEETQDAKDFAKLEKAKAALATEEAKQAAQAGLITKKGKAQLLGPFQVFPGISVDPAEAAEIKITRLISKTGSNEQGDAKDRDFGSFHFVKQATFLVPGAFSAHHAKSHNCTSGDIQYAWESLINGAELRKSGSSGLRWVSKLTVYVHDDLYGRTGAKEIVIELPPPPAAAAANLV